MSPRTALFLGGLVLALVTALLFLLLPIVALLTAVAPQDLGHQLRSPVVAYALIVSLKTNLIANALMLAIGTPAAYLITLRRFPGRSLLITLIELPLVLPPAVAGIALLMTFGAFGLLGPTLAAHGVFLPFSQVAVVLAITFVATPFYLRAAITAFAAVSRDQLDAARDLGASEGIVFARVALPLAADGLRAGWAVAFARGIGEFGATLLFAGSVERITETLPLAVYAQLGVDIDSAVAIGVLLVLISGAVLLIAKLPPLWSPAKSTPSVGGW